MTYLLPRLASCEVCGGGLAFHLFLETDLPLIHPEAIIFFFSSITLGSILTWEGGRMKEERERKDKIGNKRGREEKTKDTSSSGLPEQNTADLTTWGKPVLTTEAESLASVQAAWVLLKPRGPTCRWCCLSVSLHVCPASLHCLPVSCPHEEVSHLK